MMSEVFISNFSSEEEFPEFRLYSLVDAPCEHSPGNVNEFYSNGDYWWRDETRKDRA